jgi:hypothetical protein
MPVDFAGQRLAEQVFQVLIAVFSVVAFVAGYGQQCVGQPSARCGLLQAHLQSACVGLHRGRGA